MTNNNLAPTLEIQGTDAPGGCDGYYRFYSDDPDGLARKLNEELRPYVDPET